MVTAQILRSATQGVCLVVRSCYVYRDYASGRVGLSGACGTGGSTRRRNSRCMHMDIKMTNNTEVLVRLVGVIVCTLAPPYCLVQVYSKKVVTKLLSPTVDRSPIRVDVHQPRPHPRSGNPFRRSLSLFQSTPAPAFARLDSGPGCTNLTSPTQAYALLWRQRGAIFSMPEMSTSLRPAAPALPAFDQSPPIHAASHLFDHL